VFSLPLNDILNYFFLLFTDKNNVANSERIITLGVFKDNSPTCDYCGFNATIPDNDYRQLQKLGNYQKYVNVTVFSRQTNK
jgi:hypothetical protein